MRFRGRCFRAHDPGWAFSPASGEGARITGGRFNPVGKAALYLSLKPETAIGECMQGLAHRMPPITLCDYDVDCDPIADLSSEEGRSSHGVVLAELACPWLALMLDGGKVPSQEVAARLESEGYAGILVPSLAPGARPDDLNLVLWKWGDDPPTMVKVFDPTGRLPKDRASWTS